MEAKQTPLIELLEQVPHDARVVVEHDQFSSSSHPVGRLCHEAAAALRERLAQPEQEPVAWRWKQRINNDFDSWVISASEPPPYAIEQQPLYTSPPKREWVGLTDEEINSVRYNRDWTAPWTNTTFARAIEAKLREKNNG